MATSFSGGRSRSTRIEPPTMDKQLVDFITCGCESSASFLWQYLNVNFNGKWPWKLSSHLFGTIMRNWSQINVLTSSLIRFHENNSTLSINFIYSFYIIPSDDLFIIYVQQHGRSYKKTRVTVSWQLIVLNASMMVIMSMMYFTIKWDI